MSLSRLASDGASDGPRMTRRTSSKRALEKEADGDAGPDAPPPLKSGLTEIMGSSSIAAKSEPAAKKAKGGINDKTQQKKWANKRDEIRAKRRASTVSSDSGAKD